MLQARVAPEWMTTAAAGWCRSAMRRSETSLPGCARSTAISMWRSRRCRRQARPDNLQLQRLKKRKLVLKDRISALEDKLLPDIIA